MMRRAGCRDTQNIMQPDNVARPTFFGSKRSDSRTWQALGAVRHVRATPEWRRLAPRHKLICLHRVWVAGCRQNRVKPSEPPERLHSPSSSPVGGRGEGAIQGFAVFIRRAVVGVAIVSVTPFARLSAVLAGSILYVPIIAPVALPHPQAQHSCDCQCCGGGARVGCSRVAGATVDA